MGPNFEHCAALVRESDHDRYLSALFAPAERRDGLFALYAFNTEIARVRDLAREPMPGEIRLQWWREVLTGERDGEAVAHPVAAALLETLARYDIVSARLLDLIDAREFDIYDDPMPDLAVLEAYALKTDGVLFSLSAHILGAQHAESIAGHAGIACAVSGLLMALPLHAARHQLYVPLDVLGRHGANAEDVFAGKTTPELRAALAELRLYARRQLAVARGLFADVPEMALPALLPAALVRPTLTAMENKNYDPFHPRTLPRWRRQWLLWRAALNPVRILG